MPPKAMPQKRRTASAGKTPQPKPKPSNSKSVGPKSLPAQAASSSSQPDLQNAPPGVCKAFYHSGKCNRAYNCKFRHERASGRTTPAVANIKTAPAPPTPHNVCRQFWSSGTCANGFDCRYKHENPSTVPANRGRAASAPANPSTSLTPDEAINALHRFRREGYKFFTSLDIYVFVGALSSAQQGAPGWELSDGNMLLNTVADPNSNLFVLIDTILRHSSVSVTAGRAKDVLSFQRGYLPILSYFTSSFVARSTLHTSINALYGLLDNNFERVAAVLTSCIPSALQLKTFGEGEHILEGRIVFRTVMDCLDQYASRYRRAISGHQVFAPLVRDLSTWLEHWANAVVTLPPTFEDKITATPVENRRFVLSSLQKSLKSLMELVDLAEGSVTRIREPRHSSKATAAKAAAARAGLELLYDPPGAHRPGGARHDNDHEDIVDIRVAPTHDELCSPLNPYLPANIPGGPHHLPETSMARVMDIQFRLLREEFVAPIRSSVSQILGALQTTEPSPLKKLLSGPGGLYKSREADSTFFSVYTGIEFEGLSCDVRQGLCIQASFNAPAKACQNSADARAAYWESVGRKRLMQGGLVALIWHRTPQPPTIYLGIITNSLKDLVQSVRQNQNRVQIRFSLFDRQAHSRVLADLQRKTPDPLDFKYLLEAPVMFESIRPFLETLQKTSSTAIPFARYLAFQEGDSLEKVEMQLPLYASRPGYSISLDCLFDRRTRLSLRPSDATSVAAARLLLKQQSRLDSTQADALLDTLLSEVSLIQGPPGTGKSYTGVELLRVLIANEIRPVLLIAFTNHALDNILLHVLDKKITTKVVRLGSRSADETISQYSLDNLSRSRDRSPMAKAAGKEFAKLKEIEKEMEALVSTIKGKVPSSNMIRHLSLLHPNHLDELEHPPRWVDKLYGTTQDDDWETVGREAPPTLLDFWLDCSDLKFITPPQETIDSQKRKGKKSKGKLSNKNRYAQFDESTSQEATEHDVALETWHGTMLEFFSDLDDLNLPTPPSQSRAIGELLEVWEVWEMGVEERRALHGFWSDEVREASFATQAMHFERLETKHAETRERWQGMIDEAKLEILNKADLIGCTTNGAAKLTNVLTSVAPKVLLVEEAGQVLEAHILASLVPSIEHMILIGDPQQLRPTIQSYHLSMDNPRTGPIYRFDQSLMERLSGSGLRMLRLDVQRRMRPAISDLIRYTLYERLEDHALVREYPCVRGMAHDVYFLDHRHGEEGGGEESVSKTNLYEVKMIKDLVMHFLKQGIYSKQGDIVVLCAYLGQLQKIRAALSKEVATVIDERDALQLLDHEEQNEQTIAGQNSTATQVQVSKQVLLRTVDNFQGEEGTIVILSLVRNSGQSGTARKGGIGFLKSENRTNVALSRAKHGLYILGNAQDLSSQSNMWRKVVQQMSDKGCLGPALPIACHRHPATVREISEPGQLALHAPDGGCLLPCDAQLPCGHHCPYKCHSDDGHHTFTTCTRECTRLCAKSVHPCEKRCAEPCGKCQSLVPIMLKCGHVNKVPCWQTEHAESVKCTEAVIKKLLHCEHSAWTTCSTDPVNIVCRSECSLRMSCCDKQCHSECGRCQMLNKSVAAGAVNRLHHATHPCTKQLPCRHFCGGACTADHNCSDVICQKPCQQGCRHHKCKLPCSSPCAPCKEPCDWACDHHVCPVPCGAPCARLPCDQRCTTVLACGHRCPSVCGEPCDAQVCVICAPLAGNDPVVDLIMSSKLSELDPHGEDLDSLVITLMCGHVFTVETLDGICDLKQCYTWAEDEGGRWLALGDPLPGLQQLPTCPLCRGPINSSRYGRIFKRANLDLSERNVANHYRRLLLAVDSEIQTFDLAAMVGNTMLSISARDSASGDEGDAPAMTRPSFATRSQTPMAVNIIGNKIQTFYRLPNELVAQWKGASAPLLKAYASAVAVAGSRPAHVQAYEAAVTVLYHRHLDSYETTPDLFPDGEQPKEAALAQAHRDCGMVTAPIADLSFRVKAFWATMKIRFKLFELASAISTRIKATESKPTQREWSEFIGFLLESIENDARITLEIARGSRSEKQVVTTHLFLMEAWLASVQHQVNALAQGLSQQTVQQLKVVAQGGVARAKTTVATVGRSFRDAMGGHPDDQVWFAEHFAKSAEDIIDGWNRLIVRMEKGILTKTEKRSIIKALREGSDPMTTRGHFYQCPNGHPYVIGDCGGAMQASRCPECGSTIGGDNHVLDRTNAVASDFEQLAQEQGLGASPWAWNRGA